MKMAMLAGEDSITVLYRYMTDQLMPYERSRAELGSAIDTHHQAGSLESPVRSALRMHLGVDYMLRSPAIVKKCESNLAAIAARIVFREHELESNVFVREELGATGLLACAVGRDTGESQGRLELRNHPLIVATEEKYPGVDKNVFIDKFIINDLRWLYERLKPRGT